MREPVPVVGTRAAGAVEASVRARDRRLRMQDRYDALVVEMKKVHGLRVRKWRSSTTGVAWEIGWADGARSRLIEAPYPRGPMSCAVFLHEVGHHAIGFRTYRLRCEEEYHAWRWSLHAMVERDFPVTPPVHKRVTVALAWAVAKARRRGLRTLPATLLPFDDPALLELARPRSGPGPRLPEALVPGSPGRRARRREAVIASACFGGEHAAGTLGPRIEASAAVACGSPSDETVAVDASPAIIPRKAAANAFADTPANAPANAPADAPANTRGNPRGNNPAPHGREASNGPEGWWRLGPLFSFLRGGLEAR